MRKAPLLVLTLLLAISSVACAAPPEAPSKASATPVPKPATAADVLAAVAAARGKVVLVNAWASWCMPCRKEMPDLLKLRGEMHDKGFEMILVSADFEADLPKAQNFLAAQGVDFASFQKKQRDQDFIDGLDTSWSGSLPFTMLFDRDGARVTSWEGDRTLEQLRSSVLPLIQAKESAK